MRMVGEQTIAAPRQKVWEALNDPAVLSACIPGCQSLEREGENRLVAVVEVKIGPIGARFKGAVTLSDLDPPSACVITGSGSGGIAGSAKGSARVRLSDHAGGTLVSYEVDAEVGGRMAQLGGPIIDATAKQLAGKFFTKFGEVVGGTAPAAAEARPAAAVASAAPAPSAFTPSTTPAPGGMPWGWVAAIVAALLAGFAFGAHGERTEMLVALVALVVTAAAAHEAGRRGGAR